MTKKIVFIFLAIMLLVSLLVAGCDLAPQKPISVNIAKTGVLNLYSVDPLTLDPAVASEMISNTYIMQIYNGLVKLGNDMEPAPDIAEKWQTSSDGLTYTFFLRRDVKFQDGKAVKAGDFKYSWERACDPALRSQSAATYLGDIAGVNDVLTGKIKEISGVKVIDDYTLEVKISKPKSYFLAKLTFPTCFVVDGANVNTGQDWWHKPNGTGLFKLNQWAANSVLILDKNDLFYDTPAKLNQVVYQFYSGMPMDLYETSKIDIVSASMGYIDKVLDKSGSFYNQLQISPELSFYYIGFNCKKPPFDDINVRRAFSMALDKDKMVALIFRDMVQKADGILPPGLPGFNKNLTGLGYDVNKAKDLIKASRYGDASKLPPITITTQGRGGMVSKFLESIVFQWRQNLGVDVQIRQLEPEYYLYNLKKDKNEMYDMGWVADYPHPQDFLEVLFRSGMDNNFGEYSNAEVDAMLEKAGTESNRDISYALYQQAEQKLVQDAACIPISFGKNYTLVKAYVKGYKLNPLGLPNLNEVTVNKN